MLRRRGHVRLIGRMLRIPMPNRTIVGLSTCAISTKRMIKSQLQASARRKVDTRNIGSLSFNSPLQGSLQRSPLREDKAMIVESPLQREPLLSKLPLLLLHRSPPRPIGPLTRGNARKLLSSRLRYRITL